MFRGGETGEGKRGWLGEGVGEEMVRGKKEVMER